jgi:CRP/FNR family transcriptional regulator
MYITVEKQKQIDEKIRQFCEVFPLKKFESQECILRAENSTEFLFFLQDGCVKMTSTLASGQNVPLHIFYPGSCFSLLSLVNNGHNNYDFTAITSADTFCIPQTAFQEFLQKNGEVCFAFLANVLRGNQGLLSRLEHNISLTAYQQVAGLLLYFLKHHPDLAGTNPSSIRLTHQEIADWLGLSRENVSIQMKKLEREKFIGKVGKFVTVLQPTELEKISESLV